MKYLPKQPLDIAYAILNATLLLGRHGGVYVYVCVLGGAGGGVGECPKLGAVRLTKKLRKMSPPARRRPYSPTITPA